MAWQAFFLISFTHIYWKWIEQFSFLNYHSLLVNGGLTFTLCLSFWQLMVLARLWVKSYIGENLIRNFTAFFFQLMKTFHFPLPAGTLLSNMIISMFVGLQLFGPFLFFTFIFVKIKSRSALLLNTGRVCLINFVTMNLLGGVSCFFIAKKVKAFIRTNTKSAN